MNICDSLKEGILTNSPEEMLEVAGAFAEVCPENLTLELSGDLGAGKTVFVKGLARAWKIPGTVTSPTFNIFSIYHGERNLLHMDAYRLESADQVDALMIEDFLQPPFCLAVEWPEKVADWLPAGSWRLQFSIEPDHSHRVQLVKGP
jgi:tRNA threonylcarbamoyladenosine biosynthesis protein TsaE